MAGVLDYAERMNEQDFDRSRPLWECAVLTDLDDGRAAVLMKIHHSITDGMGGMAMSAVLFDLTRVPADLGPMPSAPIARPANMLGRIRQGIEYEARQVLGELSTATDYAVSAVKTAVSDPLGSTLAAAEFTASAVKMLAPQGAPPVSADDRPITVGEVHHRRGSTSRPQGRRTSDRVVTECGVHGRRGRRITRISPSGRVRTGIDPRQHADQRSHRG